MALFRYSELFQSGKDKTSYRLLTKKGVTVRKSGGETILKVSPEGLACLAREAVRDASFYLRAAHLKKLAVILNDRKAPDNDRFVASALLRNAVISARGVLPLCQDTGTVIVHAEKGEKVRTGVQDAGALSRGIYRAFQEENLRYSQVCPLSMFEEKNSETNLPAQIDIYSVPGNEYRFLFLAKGGGSSNKTFLFQETKSLLNEKAFEKFICEKLFALGTAACPPYHIAIVIGGTSPEANLKYVKLATAGYYDGLPSQGTRDGRAFRDREWEGRILNLAQRTGIGAQFGGKYLAHDVRVIRLPRHAASCPVGIGVSCSADRNIKAKITRNGIFLEKLERDPGKYFPKKGQRFKAPVRIDLDQPMGKVLRALSNCPKFSRLSLSGTMILARDAAHARIRKGMAKSHKIPAYLKEHPVCYAGPARTPKGLPSGSFGPTTSSRMDAYAEEFMRRGASLVMVGKGNRSSSVKEACRKFGGFYLGAIGGTAALFAEENVVSSEILDFPDLGMEAVRKIRVRDFPAWIVCDNNGNDFFEKMSAEV